MATTTANTDADELAKFGYKQELNRSLGLFSSFAAGFSYISIMTGVFELFFFGFAQGGPAFIWTWPAVFAGQMLVALCFAELAGQYPLAGSVYQWSKQIAGSFTSWIGGWVLTVGSVVTLAAVAVAYQVVLPLISSKFEIIGGKSDIGQVATSGGAKNALLLAAGLVVFTTVINMIGVKTMARINNFGVATELIGVSLLIIFLAVHITRGPGIVFRTFGTGAGHPAGYFGAFLVAGLMSAYVMYGFDTAGSLAEETHDPRRHAPPAIIRALTAAGIAGLLVILFALMSAPNIHAPQIGTSGLPYLVKATLGGTTGDIFLIDSVIAITVCSLAVHTGGIRMIFTMGRDGRLPFASAIARVHGRSKTPLIPSLVIGALTIGLLILNVGNQRAFFVLTSVAIIMFYVAYLCVTGPLLIARLRGKWPTPSHGPYFSLGRWGLPVNLLAVVFQVGVMVNLAWPRPAVYGSDHWYFQWGAFVFVGLLGGVGAVYYLIVHRGRPAAVLAEHRAGTAPAAVGVIGDQA
jgi:urea carboxylase system permease